MLPIDDSGMVRQKKDNPANADEARAAQTGTMPDIELGAERRRQLLRTLNMCDEVTEGPMEHDFGLADQGVLYNDEEDLLNIKMPEKYVDKAYDKAGHRMIIHDIYVENFKSYKGRHQLGPLHKNLTMILGPNGSGKSNVIDALLFVFGFRAGKIRTRKLTSLIHSSDSNDECDYCSVEIHFQEIKDLDEEKYSVDISKNYVISRSVNRDGTTQYKKNGNISSQKEIQALLKDSGIDMSHNRFLILQGEVEAIAQMRPTTKNPNEEGMLEYIEDIVGTNRFVIPIAKLAHRVAILEHKSSQFNAVCRKHKDNIKCFDAVMEAGIAYLNAKNNLNMLLGIRAKNSIANHKSTMISAKTSAQHRKDELDVKKGELKGAKAEFTEKQQLESDVLEKCTTLHTQKIDVEKLQQDWYSRDAKRENALKAGLKEIVKLTDERNQIEAEQQLIREAPEKARINLANMQVELKQLVDQEEECKKNATENLLKFDVKSATEKAKKEELDAKYAEKNNICLQMNSELTVAEAEYKDMTLYSDRDGKRLNDMKTTLEELVTSYNNDERERHRIDHELTEAKFKFNDANQQLPALKSTASLMRTRKYELDRQVDDMQHTQDQIGYRHPATAPLAEYRDQGHFPGFIGRLGDMCRCEKKYDITISTCFYGLMDYHVVKTNEDCQIGIDFLRDNKIGRSQFIFTDHFAEEEYIGMDVSPNKFPAPRLFDLIQCEHREVRKMIYNYIGDLLVVENLEEAARMDKRTKGGYRMCTMDGAIMDRAGTITGGGKLNTNRIRTDRKSLAATSQEKTDQLKKTRLQQERLKIDLDSAERRVSDLQETVNTYGPLIERLTNRSKELEPICEELKKRITGLQSAIAEHEDRMQASNGSDSSPEAVEAKRLLIEKIKSDMKKETIEKDKIKINLDKSQKKLDKMFEDMVQKNKDKAINAKARKEKLEAEMAKEQAIIDNNHLNAESVQKKWDDLEKLFWDKRREVKALEKMETGPESQIVLDGIVAQLRKTSRDWREHTARLSEVRREREVCEKRYHELQDEYKEISQAYDECLGIVDTLEARIALDEETLEKVDRSWESPETMDPTAKFVRIDDDDLVDKLEKGAIILPPECLSLLHPHKQLYDEMDITMYNNQEMNKVKTGIASLERSVEKFRRAFDEKGISQYATLVSLHLNELTSANKYAQRLAAHRRKLNELRSARLEEFSEALAFLGTTTQMLYQLITNGGDASLKFVEEGKSSDPFDAGIKFSVRPAKKSWKLIENLSGGEKTLASLCFVFAMHHFRATPLYVMDEIDAALDLNNVRLIANYIKHSERTRNAQFIIISLRNQMFEVGNRLVGIYKTNGCTQNIVIAPDRVEHGNKWMKKALEKKLREEFKKRQENQDAEAERMLLHGMQNVSLMAAPIKRKRKLATLRLADFLGDDESEDENEDPITQPGPSYRLDDIPNPFDDSDDDEGPVKRRPRRRVEDDDDESEEEEEDDYVYGSNNINTQDVVVHIEDTPSPPPTYKRHPRYSRGSSSR